MKVRENNGRFTVAGIMDSIQAGDYLSGCGSALYWGLHLLGALLGILLIGILLIGLWISDLLFGES